MITIEDAKNLAWLPFDMPVTSEEILIMADELKAISNECWYWCTFRNCYLCCIYGNEDVHNKEEMYWLPYAKDCTKIIELTENFIFPQTNIIPRIIVLRTMPGMKMRLHTDCYEKELDILEIKLRLIVQGSDSLLYYQNDNDERVYIAPNHSTYIMSGAVLHGLDNVGDDEKLTICWGDPWRGDELENTKFHSYLNDMYEKYSDVAIFKDELGSSRHHAIGIKNPDVERIYNWDESHKIRQD